MKNRPNDYNFTSFGRKADNESRNEIDLNENILTNESLCKLLKASGKRASELHNGYEMSVQKLAKVSSIEQDSIYSSVPQHPTSNLN